MHQIIQRISSYLHSNEVDGVTPDPRNLQNPSEANRLTIVPQLLAYYELYRSKPIQSYHDDIVSRADFLLQHFDEVTNRTAFDGMLGSALLSAYEVTGDRRYFDKGSIIVQQCMGLYGWRNTLNWGLMSGLALAKYYRLTGDPDAARKLREIIESLPLYQNADGSFPHYCPGSRDVHYTAWMAMELIVIKRDYSCPTMDRLLERMFAFLSRRVDPQGVTTYQEPCPGGAPGCWFYYYGLGTGCGVDYDTRAWVNELGYSALVFDYFRDGKYNDVIGYLYQLEDRGRFADKWDYMPPISDPLYLWASAEPSVVRTSVVFWSLARIYSDRETAAPRNYAANHVPRSSSGKVEDPAARDPDAPDSSSWQFALEDTNLVDWTGRPRDRGADATPPDGRPTRVPVGPAAGAKFETAEIDHSGVRLEPVRPGPAPGAFEARFFLPREGGVSLAVFDATGRRVRELVSGSLPGGAHSASWDGQDDAGVAAPSGVYFVRLHAASITMARRIALVR
jgi:hypothetical protein